MSEVSALIASAMACWCSPPAGGRMNTTDRNVLGT
jgi:hypothetical protein